MMEAIDSTTRYSLWGLNSKNEPERLRTFSDAKPAIAAIEEVSKAGKFKNLYVLLYNKILIYAVKVEDIPTLH
jgi:hypothetical protein